ncbi:MAG: outer membrane protein assembly factor BamB family protein [Planctomycetota bacterium]|jgi:outer membrane protein assembly factor BamB
MNSPRTIGDYILSLALGFGLCVIGTGYYGTAEAADWPNWRGPNHNGISIEKGWAASWPKAGPKILWEKSIGAGFSSISVGKGRVYTMGNINNTDIVYCFDENTGNEIWRHPYRSPIFDKSHEGGPAATPTVDGKFVYTFGKKGDVFCLKAATGKVVWHRNLKDEFELPDWYFAGSPLVVDKLVIFNAGTWGIALNKADGSFVWQNGRQPGGYATPVPFTMDGKKSVAIFAAKSVVGLVAATGKQLWRFPWETPWDENIADPIIVGDKVFISSGIGTGCTLLKIKGKNVTPIYRNKNMKNHLNSSVLWKGYLYGFDEKELRCMDFKTGEPVWGKKGLGKGSLMLADGKLIILSERGKLVTAKASPKGFRQLSSAQILKGKCWTVPILANGRIYARNAVGHLVCVDVRGKAPIVPTAPARPVTNDWSQFRGPNRDGKSLETGLLKKWPEGGPELLWSVEGLGIGFSSATIVDGYVYTTGMVGKRGILFAYDLDGNPKWQKSYGREWDGSHEGARTTPTVNGDRVYVYSGYGNLVCFDAKTGRKRWGVDTLKRFNGKNIKWGISESVLIFDEKVICTPGGEDATVVALDKMTGRTIWTTEGLSETSAYCCPVVIERGGRRLLLTMVQKSIVLIDPENGKVICRMPHVGKHFISAVSPVYKDGLVYATTGYGVGGEMYELSPDSTSYTQRWTDKNLDCHHGGLVFLDGNIHGSNHRGQSGNKGSWLCMDFTTGKIKYQAKLVGKGCVIWAEGLLYCYGEDDGMVGLVKPTPTGYELVSSFQITKGTAEHWAHPSISNGRLYIRHGDALMVYDISAKSGTASAAKDWPNFRGPNWDGKSMETGLLKSWPEEGPPLLWEKTGLGKGYSTVSIADGKIFTMGDRKGGQWVIALDFATRKELWAKRIGDPWDTKEAAKGRIRWRKNFKTDFGGKMMSKWGYSESPRIDGDKLLCTPGAKDAAIVALDKKTGRTIWKAATPDLGERGNDGAGYSSVVIAEICGIRQYLQMMGRGVVAVSADDGKFLWGYNRIANGVANIPMPVVKGNYVFCTTSYETGSALLKIVPSGSGLKAEEIYFLTPKEFENHHGGVVLLDGYIYGGDGKNRGAPACLDMMTGKIMWKELPIGKRSAAVLYADGHLYFRYEKGLMALLEATPERMKVKGTFKLPSGSGPSWPHPIILDGKLYLRYGDVLLCYDVRSHN